jgi:hypothetical protein
VNITPEMLSKADPKELSLSVAVGDRHSRHGRTSVVLTGSGRVETSLQIEGKLPDRVRKEPYVSEMAATAALDVMRKATQFAWDTKFPPRPGIPDEAIVVWTLSVGAGTKLEAKAWLRDVEKDAAMAPVLRAMRDLVKRVTDGVLFL